MAKQGIGQTGHWPNRALAKQAKQGKQGIGRVPYFPENRYSFFSDRTVSQILGELMDIRRDCQSWLAVGEAHYHDRKGKAQAINKAPQWLIPARIY